MKKTTAQIEKCKISSSVREKTTACLVKCHISSRKNEKGYCLNRENRNKQ